WTGNAARARLVADRKAGLRMLHAEFPAGETAPTLTLTSRVQTRNRAVDWSRPMAAHEDPAVLKAKLEATRLHPVDGVLRKTALSATQGAATDVETVRALYDWMVATACRDPKTRGCGT